MRLYLLARVALRLAGNLVTFAAVAAILLTAHGLRGQPLDALPSVFMWYLILGACRWLGRALPAPAQPPAVPAAAAIPPAAVAVSVTPAAPGAACPDFAAMKARLPAGVVRLVR